MAIAWANCLLQRPDAAQLALEHLRRVVPAGPTHDAVHCEADVVQACIDIYGDRIDRAEALVARSLDRPEAYRPWVVGVGANIQSFCDIHSMRAEVGRDPHDRELSDLVGSSPPAATISDNAGPPTTRWRSSRAGQRPSRRPGRQIRPSA